MKHIISNFKLSQHTINDNFFIKYKKTISQAKTIWCAEGVELVIIKG